MSEKRMHLINPSKRNPNALTGERKKLATGHHPRRSTLVMRDHRARKQGARQKRWSIDD